MGGTAAMAPCVALAPRRDGMPSPGTSGGIGGRPHVALRQPLPRYARRPISPNRVRPGDLGGFSVVRSAPVGEGRPSEEDDAPRRDEARGDRTGSIARLPRVSRRAGGGARLVAARRSPSPDRARARSVRLRCLPPSSENGVDAGDDADAEDGGASGSSETTSDDVAEANDADTDGGASDDAGEEKAGRDDESDTTDAAVDPIPLVIKGFAADDDDDDDADDDVEDEDDQVVTDPPVEEVLDRRSKVMAAAEANVPPSQRDPKAQSTEEALAEEAEALAEEAVDEAAAQSAAEDTAVEETLSISRETRNEFAESGSFDEAERAELDTASETSPVSDSSDDSIDDSIDPDTNPNGSGDDVKVTEGVDYAGTVTAEYTFPSSLQGKPRDDAAERFKKAFQKKDKKVGEQEEALREAFSQYADDMEDIDAEAPASATSSIAQFDPADNDEYTPRAISRVCFFFIFPLAIRLNACFVPYRPFPIKTPSWCSPRSGPSH